MQYPPPWLTADVAPPPVLDPGIDAPLQADRLLPAAWCRLAASGAAGALDEGRRGRWRRAWQGTLAANLRAMEELRAVGRLMGERRVVLLKGAAMLFALHAEAGVRPMHDVDVLVASADVVALDLALARRGFAPVREGPVALRDAELGRVVWAREGHAVEVHRRLEWAPLAIDISGMLARARPLEESGLAVLSSADALFYGLVHWVVHWRSAAYGVWPWELALLTRRGEVRWDVLVEEARRHALEPCLWHTLGVLAERWGAEVPEVVLRALRPGAVQRMAMRLLRARPRWLSLWLMNPVRVLLPSSARLAGRGDMRRGVHLRDLARRLLRRDEGRGGPA